jgi:NAD(P)-dependent dehydrogenase (short-subunit alcohol dehydrogenase family)
MQLAEKVAIITGGGSGIGAATALAFAQAGANVVVTGRTLMKVNAIAGQLCDQGGTAHAIQADVSQSADVQRLIAETVHQFGGVDVLYNNAGISPSGRITEISEADWDECMAIDLRSVFLGAKYVIPELQKRGGGVILNTAGTFGIRPARNKAAYAAAKAGVINLTRAIALDYAADHIRCNVICPGFVDTPLTAGFTGAPRAEFLAAYQPLPGVIQAEEVAALAVYLASDVAKMITGQAFVVDGGQQAGMNV